MFDRTLTVFRRVLTGATDRYGKPITERRAIGSWRCSLQPVKSAEGEAFVVDTVDMYVERAADLQAGDEFESGGRVYSINGAPFFNTMIPATLNHWSGVAKSIGPVSS